MLEREECVASLDRESQDISVSFADMTGMEMENTMDCNEQEADVNFTDCINEQEGDLIFISVDEVTDSSCLDVSSIEVIDSGCIDEIDSPYIMDEEVTTATQKRSYEMSSEPEGLLYLPKKVRCYL